MPQQTADVVIIGGGIMGSATAYALTHASSAPRRIVIVERDTAYREASTPRSAGGVRQQFSTPENIAMSQAMLSLLPELKARFGADADVSFRAQGYLILASDSGRDVLARNVGIQRSHGADIDLLDAARLAERFPWLATEGLAVGSFGGTGEGWLDPVALTDLFRKAAIARGVEVVNRKVARLVPSGDRIDGVELDNGDRIFAGNVVLAAGAWSGALARTAGLDVPVEPRKRYVYVVDCREAGDALHAAPLTVDPCGVWFRPEGRQFICGTSPAETDEPPAVDLDAIDYDPYDQIVWPALAARVPAFEKLKMTGAWAGFYDYNVLDQNAVVGRHPGFANLYVVTGFSGHGLQQGFAAGRAVAELILDGRFSTIDLTRFGCERILAKTPIFELNVI